MRLLERCLEDMRVALALGGARENMRIALAWAIFGRRTDRACLGGVRRACELRLPEPAAWRIRSGALDRGWRRFPLARNPRDSHVETWGKVQRLRQKTMALKSAHGTVHRTSIRSGVLAFGAPAGRVPLYPGGSVAERSSRCGCGGRLHNDPRRRFRSTRCGVSVGGWAAERGRAR